MTDKNDDAKTIINVKGVSVEAWEAAKKAANKQDQTMGEWLTRALNHLANLEAGPREFLPIPAANPDPETVNPNQAAALAALATLAPVLAGIGPKLTRQAASDVSALISGFAREARGLPPRAKASRRGKADGQTLLENGKAGEDEPLDACA
jgi:hypothetical protein